MNLLRPARTVLLDDYDDLIVITEKLLALEKVSISLHCFRSSQELLDTFAADPTGADMPDLLLIDLNMPRINGLEVIRRVFAMPQCADVIVGVCTGSRNPTDLDDALTSGARFCVGKPLNRERIEEICELVPELSLVSESGRDRLYRGIPPR